MIHVLPTAPISPPSARDRADRTGVQVAAGLDSVPRFFASPSIDSDASSSRSRTTHSRSPGMMLPESPQRSRASSSPLIRASSTDASSSTGQIAARPKLTTVKAARPRPKIPKAANASGQCACTPLRFSAILSKSLRFSAILSDSQLALFPDFVFFSAPKSKPKMQDFIEQGKREWYTRPRDPSKPSTAEPTADELTQIAIDAGEAFAAALDEYNKPSAVPAPITQKQGKKTKTYVPTDWDEIQTSIVKSLAWSTGIVWDDDKHGLWDHVRLSRHTLLLRTHAVTNFNLQLQLVSFATACVLLFCSSRNTSAKKIRSCRHSLRRQRRTTTRQPRFTRR